MVLACSQVKTIQFLSPHRIDDHSPFFFTRVISTVGKKQEGIKGEEDINN